MTRIPPRSGTAFELAKGASLTVIDPEGSQVSDLLAYNAQDVREAISNGRTFDYEETLHLSTGNRLWSNRSNPMLSIVEDTVRRHDFLLTPCSTATFEHFYPDKPVCNVIPSFSSIPRSQSIAAVSAISPRRWSHTVSDPTTSRLRSMSS